MVTQNTIAIKSYTLSNGEFVPILSTVDVDCWNCHTRVVTHADIDRLHYSFITGKVEFEGGLCAECRDEVLDRVQSFSSTSECSSVAISSALPDDLHVVDPSWDDIVETGIASSYPEPLHGLLRMIGHCDAAFAVLGAKPRR